VEWTDVQFLVGANAADCYTGDTYHCSGTNVDCPSQRCRVLWTGEVGNSPVYIECKDSGNNQQTKEKVEIQSYENHYKDVVKDAKGRSGLTTGEDKPCKKTGSCGCETPAPDNDEDQTKWCSAPGSLTAGPNEVKIRDVNPGSTQCVGE